MLQDIYESFSKAYEKFYNKAAECTAECVRWLEYPQSSFPDYLSMTHENQGEKMTPEEIKRTFNEYNTNIHNDLSGADQFAENMGRLFNEPNTSHNRPCSPQFAENMGRLFNESNRHPNDLSGADQFAKNMGWLLGLRDER